MDSFLTRAERHARFWDVAKKIGAGLVFAGSLIAGLVIWLNDRPSRTELAGAEARVLAVVNEQAAALRNMNERIVKLETKLDDMERQTDRNWDGLDRVLQKQFGQSILTPSPPSYGPAAHSQGRQ